MADPVTFHSKVSETSPAARNLIEQAPNYYSDRNFVERLTDQVGVIRLAAWL
jgi:hypothetical protein